MKKKYIKNSRGSQFQFPTKKVKGNIHVLIKEYTLIFLRAVSTFQERAKTLLIYNRGSIE